MFKTSQEAKEAKWFSRRHETSEAHMRARQAREARRIAKRQGVAAQRTPAEQLRRLDERLGVGIGAKRERVRLSALVG